MLLKRSEDVFYFHWKVDMLTEMCREGVGIRVAIKHEQWAGISPEVLCRKKKSIISDIRRYFY